jgi:hypothetical protein
VSTIRVGEVRFRVYPWDHIPRHVHGFVGSGQVIVDLLDDGSVALVRRNAIRRATRTEVRRVMAAAAAAFNRLADASEVHGEQTQSPDRHDGR